MNASLNNSTIAEPVFACQRQMWWCQESFRSAIYPSTIFVIVLNVFLALTAVLGNGLIFLVYYQNYSLRKPANTILLSLAVTDFLTGAVSQPLFIYEKILMLTDCTERVCPLLNLTNFIMLVFLVATLLNLSAITLDRYIAVLHSYGYLSLVTKSRVIKVLLALWLALVSIVGAGVYISYIRVPAVILVSSNVIFIVVLYYKIFKEIRRLEANPVVAVNEAEEARKAKERKSAKNVAIVLGLLFFCYVPMILYVLILIIFLSRRNLTTNIMVLNQQLFYIAITFASSNSSLNVLVYYWKNAEIRSAILKVFRSVTQRFRNEVSP